MSEAGIPKLPEFDRPPVVETVLSAQFEPLAGNAIGTLRLVLGADTRAISEDGGESRHWSRRSNDLRIVPLRRPRLRFEAREDVRPERTWFVNEAGTEMIQLQTDRFIKNWRKASDDDIYPRYERVVRPGFERDLKLFEAFLQDESLGPIKMNQCEVTYVNHIVAGKGWRDWTEVCKVFSFLGGLPGSIEDGTFVLRMPIHWNGKQVGRLIVEIQPALRATDDTQMYVMSLTARGIVGERTEFFDVGRAAVVSNFIAADDT